MMLTSQGASRTSIPSRHRFYGLLPAGFGVVWHGPPHLGRETRSIREDRARGMGSAIGVPRQYLQHEDISTTLLSKTY